MHLRTSPSRAWKTFDWRKSILSRLLGLLAVMGLAAPMMAQAVDEPGSTTLEWTANSEADVVGYKLYYGGSPGNYVRTVDVGNVTSVTVPGMISNFTYSFSVTAYNVYGDESDFAVEVSHTVPLPAGLSVAYVARGDLPANLPAIPEFVGGVTTVDGKFSFTVIATAQSALTISASSDLQNWSTLGNVTNPTGGVTITDSGSAAATRRYYRFGIVDTSGLISD